MRLFVDILGYMQKAERSCRGPTASIELWGPAHSEQLPARRPSLVVLRKAQEDVGRSLRRRLGWGGLDFPANDSNVPGTLRQWICGRRTSGCNHSRVPVSRSSPRPTVLPCMSVNGKR